MPITAANQSLRMIYLINWRYAYHHLFYSVMHKYVFFLAIENPFGPMMEQLKLRRYGSKSVVKYPRCSLRRQSTYADAEEDPPQAFALASIWVLILALGSLACLLPIIQASGLTYQHLDDSAITYNNHAFTLDFLSRVKNILFTALGSVIGYPVASASVGVLKGLWRNDLVALKGSCPNCGEEVFAFVRSDQSNSSPHKATCHVCDSSLEFRTKVEQSISRLGRRWVHGRVYLVQKSISKLQSWI
uniref:Uncharacterized protein n=1 Tax=Kalanchoe fedtschenkoi TaxID=63787 RepID=A0A7N0TCK5_KALFE